MFKFYKTHIFFVFCWRKIFRIMIPNITIIENIEQTHGGLCSLCTFIKRKFLEFSEQYCLIWCLSLCFRFWMFHHLNVLSELFFIEKLIVMLILEHRGSLKVWCIKNFKVRKLDWWMHLLNLPYCFQLIDITTDK